MSKKSTVSKATPVNTSVALQENGRHVIAESSALIGPQGVPDKFAELGTTGLLRTGNRGFVYEEFLRDLAGQRARVIYREMRDNDAIIGAILYAIEMMVRSVTWRVDGDDAKSAEFVESCIEDMSHTWEDFVAEILSMLPYGWSWHEVVYKLRKGDTNDPSTRSKYKDGKIGWRKMPIRAQETLWEWLFDDEGGVQGVVQVAPPFYKRVDLPIERCLLFRVGVHKGNPEGRSILRNAYRSWYMKRRIEEIEAIGIERDLAGLPVFYADGEAFKKYGDMLKEIVKNVRRDEQEGLIIPLLLDPKGNKRIEFSLLNSGGTRQFNTNNILDRYAKAIAMTVLADFIMLGQASSSGGSKGGSNALSENKTQMFSRAVEAILHSVAAVVNRHAIPKLLTLNKMNLEKAPKLVPGPVYTPNLTELAAFITALAGAGAPLFPDDDLENYLRGAAYLPEKPEELENQTAVPTPGTSSVPTAPGKGPKEQAAEQQLKPGAAPPAKPAPAAVPKAPLPQVAAKARRVKRKKALGAKTPNIHPEGAVEDQERQSSESLPEDAAE